MERSIEGTPKRWMDNTGRVYEWDSEHGSVNIYDEQGKHMGAFDPVSADQLKPAKPGQMLAEHEEPTHFCIYGCLPGDDGDDSTKFVLPIHESFTEQILKLLAHPDVDAITGVEQLITPVQVAPLALIIGKPLPTELDLYIGVVDYIN